MSTDDTPELGITDADRERALGLFIAAKRRGRRISEGHRRED